MSGQTIGAIGVQISQRLSSVNTAIGTVNVQVNKQQPSTVTTTIGGRTTLKSASDLSMIGVEDGDVISYVANTNTFQVKSVSALAIPKIDGGQY